MKRILYFSLIFLFVSLCKLQGQQIAESEINCTQKLRTARNAYDQGRLHEIPQYLEGCLTKTEDQEGFTDEQRIEAYKMLTLTYIYLEEPGKADEEMIHLLNTEHFYEVNELVDPIEFRNLYKKFRTEPVYRIGPKVGGNINHINVLGNHYFWGQGEGTYKSKPGVQFGAFFEKDIKRRDGHNSRFTASPELFYSSYSYIYQNSNLLFADPKEEVPNTGSAEHTTSQSKAQINLMVQYRIDKPKPDKTFALADKFIPYVALGPSVGYLLNSTFDGNTNADEQVTGPKIKTLSIYNPITVSLVASAGVKLRAGGFYITADIRYQYGLFNVINKENRYDVDELMDYGYVENDYTLSQTMFNIGLILPHFHPKKLIK